MESKIITFLFITFSLCYAHKEKDMFDQPGSLKTDIKLIKSSSLLDDYFLPPTSSDEEVEIKDNSKQKKRIVRMRYVVKAYPLKEMPKLINPVLSIDIKKTAKPVRDSLLSKTSVVKSLAPNFLPIDENKFSWLKKDDKKGYVKELILTKATFN